MRNRKKSEVYTKVSLLVLLMLTLFTALTVLFYRYVFSGTGYMASFADDFYYYLRVAENFTISGRSTFHGDVLTNGYHPLWFVILTLFLLAVGEANVFVFFLVSLVALLSVLLGGGIVYKIAKNSGCGLSDSCLLSSMCMVWCGLLFSDGMEVILTVPLLLTVVFATQKIIAHHGAHRLFKNRTAVMLGFLSSIVILSRLDSAILVLLLLGSMIYINRDAGYRKPFIFLIYFGLGGLLLPLYLLSNILVFETLLPVSGQAKQLKEGVWPGAQVLFATFLHSPAPVYVYVQIVLTFIGCFLIKGYKRVSALLWGSFLVYPWVHIFVISCLSDWKLWGWYFYPLLLSGLLSLALILHYAKMKNVYLERMIRLGVIVYVVATCFWTIFRVMRSSPDDNAIYTDALALKEFSDRNPGNYAMGDRAGMPAFLMKDTLFVQLEGLVMDKEYLMRLRNEVGLLDIFRHYDVQFYITTMAKQIDGQYHFREPAQAGPSSSVVYGTLNEGPVFTVLRNNNRVGATIFDVQR